MNGLEAGQINFITGVPEGYDAFLLAAMCRKQQGSFLHICRDDARLDRLKKGLRFFAPDIDLLAFPAWDCLPYDRVSPASDIVSTRLSALACLTEDTNDTRIVLTTINAILQRIPARAFFKGATLTVCEGEAVDRETLLAFFMTNGYRRA